MTDLDRLTCLQLFLLVWLAGQPQLPRNDQSWPCLWHYVRLSQETQGMASTFLVCHCWHDVFCKKSSCVLSYKFNELNPALNSAGKQAYIVDVLALHDSINLLQPVFGNFFCLKVRLYWLAHCSRLPLPVIKHHAEFCIPVLPQMFLRNRPEDICTAGRKIYEWRLILKNELSMAHCACDLLWWPPGELTVIALGWG